MMKSITRRDPDWYVSLYKSRLELSASDIQRIREAQKVLNNDMKIEIKELGETEQPSVANLAKLGLRQLSQRVASVEPMLYFPSLDLGKPRADADAMKRKQVVRGWQQDNSMRLRNAQRARHLLAYACMPITFRPDPRRNIPAAFVRHPLNTFPSDGDFFQFIPDNVIFTATHSYEWFLRRYPDAAVHLSKPRNWDDQNPDLQHKFTVLEYCDEYEITMVAVGDGGQGDPYSITDEEPTSCILETAANFACITPAVIPGSINLDKQEGQFDAIFGMYHAQAYLMALSMVATRLSIFRPGWVESNPGEEADVTAIPDPYTGQPGQVNGGRITFANIDPSMQALEIGAQLEYASRQTAGLPAEFGGMSPTNVRTGRRAQQVMSNTIDFTVSESQDIFAKSTRDEIHIQMEIDKAYFNRTKKYFIVTRDFSGTVEYQPSKLFPDPCPVQVDYPMGGVDLQNLPIEGGQRINMKTMSRRRFMDIDPAVPDADAEERRMTVEGINDAFLASILTMAADPMAQAFQPIDMANLKKMVLSGLSLEDAVIKVQEQAQARQSEIAAPGTPATQPGLSQPGLGTEQPTPPTDDRSMENMSQLLSQLGTVQQAQRSRANNGSI